MGVQRFEVCEETVLHWEPPHVFCSLCMSPEPRLQQGLTKCLAIERPMR